MPRKEQVAADLNQRIQTADLSTEQDELNHSNFIWEKIKESFDPLTQQVVDTQINTSDLPMATNFYDFCLNRNLGAEATLPFARQLWVMLHLFNELCPRCSDDNLFHNPLSVPVDMVPQELVDRLQLMKNGVCPRCHARKGSLLRSGELNPYNSLVACWGQRGGKSTTVSLASGYITQIFLKVPQLSTIGSVGIMASTPLTATFVALTSSRSKRLLWQPFVSVLTNSEWFKAYHKILTDAGKRLGHEILKFNNDTITYNHRNLGLYYMGPMKRALRGDTRFLGAIDELGLFPLVDPNEEEDESRELANADEVYISLYNSLGTLQVAVEQFYKKGIDHIPTGYLLNCSSPMSTLDKIWRLLEESKDSKTLLGSNLATWEVNPYWSKNSPTIVEAYRSNPTKAERDWGAKPPSSDTQWYKRAAVEPLFTGKNHVRVAPVLHSMGLTGKVIWTHQPSNVYPSLLALDAGYSNNSFAGAVMHLEEDRIKVTALFELIPREDHKIWFNDVYASILKPIIERLNVYYLATDRWQSISVGQQAREDFVKRDFDWIAYSLTSKDFVTFDVDMIDGQRLILPELEKEKEEIYAAVNYRKDFLGTPASHLLHQFSTIRKLQSMMVKGPKNTDDLYRSVVLGSTVLRSNKVFKRMIELKPVQRSESTSRATILSAGRRI